MKKYIAYLCGSLLLTAMTVGCGSKTKTDSDENNNKEKTETVKIKPATKKYKVLAEKSNKSMPQPLPGGIRIDKVEAVSEKEYKYYMTFIQEPGISLEEFNRSAKLALSMGLQNNQGEDLEMFRKDKMTVIYAYYKLDGSLYSEIRIEPSDYIK